MKLIAEEVERRNTIIGWRIFEIILRYPEMLLWTWFVICLMFTTAKQNVSRRKIRGPNRRTLNRRPCTPNNYRSLRTETGKQVNSLSLITLDPNWTTIKIKIGRRRLSRKSVSIKQTESRTLTTRRIQAANKNVFIELNTDTPFVPKKITTPEERVSYSSTTVNLRNYTPENHSELPSTTVDEIDEKVLTKIQLLESELKSMQMKLKNDTATIENLKSKVLKTDKEIAEINYTDAPNLENKNTDTTALYTKDQFTIQRGFETTARTLDIEKSAIIHYTRTTIKDNIKELTNSTGIYRMMTNRISTSPESSLKRDLEFGQTNTNNDVSVGIRRHFVDDYKEIPTQRYLPDERFTNINDEGQLVYENTNKGDMDIPQNGQYFTKGDFVLGSQEYQKLLEEERIEKGIDWKKFNPEAFLAQISAELKEKTKLYPMNPEMLTMMPFSGRRMLSNKRFGIRKRDYPQVNIPYATTTTNDMLAPAPPRQRKVVLATGVPIAPHPDPSLYDEFNAEDSVKPDVDYFPNPDPKTVEAAPKNVENKLQRRILAPQAGKQKLVLESTEALVKKVLGRLTLGKSDVPPSLDFDVFRQRLHRDNGKERKKLHEKIAKRLSTKISGRRNMDPVKNVNEDLSDEILRDPFLNDSFI